MVAQYAKNNLLLNINYRWVEALQITTQARPFGANAFLRFFESSNNRREG